MEDASASVVFGPGRSPDEYAVARENNVIIVIFT